MNYRKPHSGMTATFRGHKGLKEPCFYLIRYACTIVANRDSQSKFFSITSDNKIMNGSLRLSKRTNLLILFSVTALCLSVFTTSCTINQKQPVVIYPDLNQARTAEKQSQANNVEQRILKEYRRWKGTRHRLGGTSSQGIDCSGFVKAVYKNVFNINLPRTTKAQVRQGKSISFNELQPGDLVFFKPPNYPRHVGIFISQSQFAHASKTRGVTISKIDAHYWSKYYWTARRIIPVTKNR